MERNGTEFLRQLAAHLCKNRVRLRAEWARRIRQARLLDAMSNKEILSETAAVYDKYVKALESGSVESLRAYARDLSKRIIPRGIETGEAMGAVLLLRDICARSLFRQYRSPDGVLDAYERAANRITLTVSASFVRQRERVTRRTHEELRTVSNRILHAQEEERKRISRDLHDEVGQALTAIHVNFAMLQRGLKGHGRRGSSDEALSLEQSLGEARRLLARAMETVHGFARKLRPTLLDELGLAPALRSYAREFSRHTGLEVRTRCGIRDERLNAPQKIALFRIVQEGLTNVAKHAGATLVEIALRPANGAVQMSIRDNGAGFAAPPRSSGKSHRLGLLGMQERARLAGGRLVVRSGPGYGTTIWVEIPLNNGKASAALDTASEAAGSNAGGHDAEDHRSTRQRPYRGAPGLARLASS